MYAIRDVLITRPLMPGITGGTRWATCCLRGARTVPCGCGRRRRAPVCRYERIMTLRLSLSTSSSSQTHFSYYISIKSVVQGANLGFRTTLEDGRCCWLRLHQAMISHGIEAPKRQQQKNSNANARRPPLPTRLPLLPYLSLHTSAVGKIDAASARAMRMKVFAGHESKVSCVMFTTSGKAVVTASDDATVRVWAPRTGECRHVFGGHGFHVGAVTCLAR